ncbi:MAG: hypothetical protein RLN60_04540 [Phycisphaerales bacterium]
MNIKNCIARTAPFVIAAPAIAGPMEEEEHFDIYIQQDTNGRLITGGANDETFETVPGLRVFEAEFGEDGSPNFIDEPGLFANDLPAGTQIGFTITAPLRAWNGGDFSTIAAETITVHQAFGIPGSPAVTTPGASGERAFGFVAATADLTGFFDEHADFVLDAPSGNGVYLLTLTLWVTDGSTQFGHSKPVHIIFGQNADHELIELAEEFVEDNIANLPAPGATGLAAVAVMAATRRRRA